MKKAILISLIVITSAPGYSASFTSVWSGGSGSVPDLTDVRLLETTCKTDKVNDCYAGPLTYHIQRSSGSNGWWTTHVNLGTSGYIDYTAG